MRNELKTIMRHAINSVPRSIAGAIIGRVPRLVPYLDERDVVINLSNPYYGKSRVSLSRVFRIESELLYRHAYDQKTLLYLMRLVNPGDFCLDIGANIGAITLSLAHRVGPRGKVIAFEPGPFLFQRLLRNISLSRYENIDCEQIGLSDEDGTLYWTLETGANCGNAFLSSEPTKTAVPVIRLDQFARVGELPRLDMVKVDVEGMELRVIRGGLDTIRRYKPNIILETLLGNGADADSDVETVLEVLEGLGYSFWEIDVPEERLIPFKPDFRFIRCSYPNLPQNTLCVHATREGSL